MRLNLTIDDDHAAVLARLAERTHVQPGTLARSILLTALDHTVEAEARGGATELERTLDGIEGAYERAQLGREQAARGEKIPLSDL